MFSAFEASQTMLGLLNPLRYKRAKDFAHHFGFALEHLIIGLSRFGFSSHTDIRRSCRKHIDEPPALA